VSLPGTGDETLYALDLGKRLCKVIALARQVVNAATEEEVCCSIKGEPKNGRLVRTAKRRAA